MLQTVLVVFYTRNLLQAVDDARPDLLDAALLVGLDRSQQVGDVINLLCELLLQGCTLLRTEIDKVLQSLLHSIAGSEPLLFLEFLHICLRQHIGHAEQSVEPVGRHGDARLIGNTLNLVVIVFYQRGIDRRCIDQRIFLYPKTQIHLSANQCFGHHLAHLHLFLTIEGCNTCVQVKLLGIERLDLYMNLFFLVSYDSLAVACH